MDIAIKNKSLLESCYAEISPYLYNTPLIYCDMLSEMLGHDIYFKLENLQKTGSFKVRGVLSSVRSLMKQEHDIKTLVAYSTGNHGVALSWAGAKFGFKVELYLPKFTCDKKQELAKRYGANVIITETRTEAENMSLEASRKKHHMLIPPSDKDEVIVGASTVAYEVHNALNDFDAMFVPIGGGSLSSGSVFYRDAFGAKTAIYAGEPKSANDAAISYKSGQIFRFKESPETVADGARTLGVTPRIFKYVQNLDGIFEIEEDEILHWTAWIAKASKTICEPTSALSMGAAYRWLKAQKTKKSVVVVISGGNFEDSIYNNILSKYNNVLPKEFL